MTEKTIVSKQSQTDIQTADTISGKFTNCEYRIFLILKVKLDVD